MTGIATPWTGHYMEPAFLSCVHWALGDADVVAAYRADTGDGWQPARSPLDRMIDESAGAEAAFLQRFSGWVADTIFGWPEDVEELE